MVRFVDRASAGAYNCCREVVPRMIERGAGRIVNLTSYAGARPAPYQSGYACAKAAVNSLTESLAAELGQHGISVFGVAPGFTRTDMTEHLTASEAGARWLPDAGSGRIVEAEDTARLIVRARERVGRRAQRPAPAHARRRRRAARRDRRDPPRRPLRAADPQAPGAVVGPRSVALVDHARVRVGQSIPNAGSSQRTPRRPRARTARRSCRRPRRHRRASGSRVRSPSGCRSPFRCPAASSTPTHSACVGEPGLRSTITSKIAPAVQRTSFTSSCGGVWKCMPRNVPALLLREMLHCESSATSPCSANSSRHHVRAKNPRSSSWRSGSTM